MRKCGKTTGTYGKVHHRWRVFKGNHRTKWWMFQHVPASHVGLEADMIDPVNQSVELRTEKCWSTYMTYPRLESACAKLRFPTWKQLGRCRLESTGKEFWQKVNPQRLKDLCDAEHIYTFLRKQNATALVWTDWLRGWHNQGVGSLTSFVSSLLCVWVDRKTTPHVLLHGKKPRMITHHKSI